ncbi:MAG: ABC transporter substrate-binding protein [Acetobacteraceae bacterium]|nr:ABC transporter substrate-binding protein [Acetobacteraceae bacterium]
MPLRRRTLPLLLLSLPALPARAAAAIRLGTLRFGSMAWELDVIRAHRLDKSFAFEPVEFATGQASQVALQAGGVDVILQDWLWVSRQRASGADWTFSPASAALGAILAAPGSPVQRLADLPGRRLGIAGSPVDKSWLLLLVFAARTLRLDLAAAVEKTFGPPPLLAEQLEAGRLDAVLTYWPFAARGEAQGLRVVLDMEDVLTGLDIPPGLPLLGYVFSEAWAVGNRDALQSFLEASREARTILAGSDAEWERIAPLTGAASPAELARLRSWYRRGIPGAWTPAAQDASERLYHLLAQVGGPDLVGPAKQLSKGTFWRSD